MFLDFKNGHGPMSALLIVITLFFYDTAAAAPLFNRLCGAALILMLFYALLWESWFKYVFEDIQKRRGKR